MLSLYALVTVGCGKQKAPEAAASPTLHTTVSVPPASRPAPSQTLAAGTVVDVEISEVFDSDTSLFVQFLIAHVAADVKGADGALAIPSGSNALLVNRGMGKVGTHSIANIGLNRVDVAGKTFKTVDGVKDLAALHFDEDTSRGAGHRSIHLERASRLTFKLDETVQLR